ncbi:hypothetical protein ACEQ8H_002403 [Pleosporales sp. CAS-2024a]
MALLNGRALLLMVVTLILLPFVTYYLSTTLFYRRVASRSISPAASRLEVLDKLYGLPAAALGLYAGKSASKIDMEKLNYIYGELVDKHLTGPALITSVEQYMTILSANLHDKMFQVGSWTQIEDSWAFFQQVFTRCLLASLFGTDLVKQYPGIIKDYWEFANAVDGFLPGLPRYWVPGAASPARDRLHSGISKWLKANLGGSESARIAANDPSWHADKGAKFTQERDYVLSRIEAVNNEARVAEILHIMHE